MRQIFVFGSNRQGRHGKGAALEARLKHGAVYGQAEGLQGNSYAIVTKDLRAWYNDGRAVTLEEINESVGRFLDFACLHPDWQFNVSPIGCGLAGFTPEQIGPLFIGAPSNVKLPKTFLPYLR
jgi:hypothetical protein